ncbi:Uncharacterized protein OS=delta proteobacterium NaphS2 GN=NPH_0071 PE=4 SV=1 [Gemmata massiliana]|uniref:Uncharacterized protein n=1 Tax=Gemmata massiliana TaxID=1210884 RepID=A0A6P2DL60_9BACT|nr:hypothetical protein [Gemmata massiliana]VTS01296.1 Uncharacterized protein OS=delta proteobacterium NaphS2 GN=NPH_0071 PE=4 SV=1 [Gemmata massiliana]
MSEYQYYEFRAIDRSLDRSAMSALRALSTRAQITSASFTNEYSYGDFRGDPDKLMEAYFDAHLYVANWGTHQLMLRVPVQLLPLSAVGPYTAEEGLRAWATGTHVILDFASRSEDDYGWTEGAGQLDPLLPVRAELLAGDLRALYLGWLAAVESGEIDEGATEPPVPPGLGTLSPALTDFAEFLRVDPDLIEIAASASGSQVPTGPSVADLASWVAELPEGEKNTALVQLLGGEGASAAVDLLSQFRADAARATSRGGASPPGARRTVGELLAARERVAEENRRRAAEKKAHEESRLARERAEARASLGYARREGSESLARSGNRGRNEIAQTVRPRDSTTYRSPRPRATGRRDARVRPARRRIAGTAPQETVLHRAVGQSRNAQVKGPQWIVPSLMRMNPRPRSSAPRSPG